MDDSTVLSTGKVVLVVDDNRQVAEVLAELLVSEGHDVDRVTNGSQALERIEERRYDLIISDVGMPGLDGPGLYQALTCGHPELLRRIIFLSGNVLEPSTEAFIRKMVVPTLAKPVDMINLRRTIDEVLHAG